MLSNIFRNRGPRRMFVEIYNLDKNVKLRYRMCFLLSIFYFLIITVYFLKIPLKSESVAKPSRLTLLQGKRKAEDILQKAAERISNAEFQKKNKKGEEEKILTKVFRKADVNEDEFLDTVELIAWIAKRIKEHLTQALKDNIFIFTAIDIYPRDGFISWEEYMRHFFKNRGHTSKFIEDHLNSLKGMKRETKEAVMREKAAWSQASRDDPNKLNLNDFLSFRHPESSHASIISMVDEVLSRLDVDEDGMLSENEFSDPDLNEVPNHLTNDQFIKERVKEFGHALDEDGDGKADRKELIAYYSPGSAHHAEKEAMELLAIADANGDRKLSLDEILARKDHFMRSKMVDVSISFHDEF